MATETTLADEEPLGSIVVRKRTITLGDQAYQLKDIARLGLIDCTKTRRRLMSYWRSAILVLFIWWILNSVGELNKFSSAPFRSTESNSSPDVWSVLASLLLLGYIGYVLWEQFGPRQRLFLLTLEMSGLRTGIYWSRTLKSLIDLRNGILDAIENPPDVVQHISFGDVFQNINANQDVIVASGENSIGKMVKNFGR